MDADADTHAIVFALTMGAGGLLMIGVSWLGDRYRAWRDRRRFRRS